MAKENEKLLGILAHVLGWLTSFIGPLIILLAAKDSFSKQNARAALNWQISLIIYSTVSAILTFVIIGILMLIALGIINLVFCIVAAVKAGDGEVWDYPMSIKFLKQNKQ